MDRAQLSRRDILQRAMPALMIAAAAALFAALAHAGIALTRGNGPVAALWLPNAVLAAILLRNRTGACPYYLAACFVANLIVNALAGDGWRAVIAMSLANSIEVILVVWSMRKLCGRNPDVAELRTLACLLFVAVIAPAVSGSVAAAGIATGSGIADFGSLISWILADGLSLMIVTPIVMIGVDTWRARRRLNRADLIEWSLFLAITLAASTAIFSQSHFPFLFLACPIVIVAAFRTGIAGTAVAIAIIAAVASAATMLGSGPIMLVRGDAGDKLIAFQLFIATSFAMGLPVAAALASRAAFQRELQASRDFNQSILDNLQEVVFRTDANGRWTFLNPAWEAVTGYGAAESMGWNTTRLLHAEDREAAVPLYAAIVAGQLETAILQQRFYRASGELRHIEVVVRRLAGANGEFIGTAGNIRDVSERVRNELELAESERRFQTLANLAPAGIFRTDVDGRCTYVNAAWLRITGLAGDAWRDEGWASALHPDDARRVFDGWARAVRERAGFRDEFRWIRPDGAEVWTDVSAGPEVSDTGELLGFIGVTMDVTDRRLAEQELAARDEQLSLLANNATDAVFRVALDGRCLYASPSARGLLGVDPRHLAGVQMLDRFHPEDDAGVRATFAALARGEFEDTIIAYRSELVGEPGSYRWLEAHCGLVRDAAGAPQEIIASIRDVSKNKALEEDLRKARQRAEAASAAKAAFLANMSHEIRTPMNGVLGFTELLANSDLDDEQRRQVQLISDSGRAMMRLLNDILDMSKIDSGQMQVTAEPVDLASKLRGCARLMEPVARAKGVALNVTIDPDLPKGIVSDPLRLRQIMLNLLGNAVKFTAHGSIDVRAASEEGVLTIAVADTGEGIAADRLDTIFQQFTQADASVARRHGGTGLGLAISAELARLMGGSIGVTSTPGRGSVFTLRLPLVAAAEGAPPPPPEVPAGTPAPEAGTRRVLIAEDHDINQQLIAAIARQAGLDAAIVADGEQAIAAVQRAEAEGQPFGLVLMDMQMPVIDGLEATRRIRALGIDAARLPIVALTANAYREDVQACLDAGMQAHLSKPVDLATVRAAAARFIPAGGTRPDATPSSARISASASLAEQYQARKRETLASVAAAAERAGMDDEKLEAILSDLHKLAGTAGFFGDGALGRIAAMIEQELRAAVPESRPAILLRGARQLADAA